MSAPLERVKFQLKYLNGAILRKFTHLILYSTILMLLIFPLKFVLSFLTFPNPIEYREVASISPALDLSVGINPYNLKNYPEHIYLYGVLYPLTMAPFIKLGNHPLIVARIYNVLFLILFLALSFWIFRKRNASINSSLIGVLILLNSMCFIWRINGARPDAPGLFFSFLSFYFLLKGEPDTVQILLCAVSSVISFYFKQYFLFSTIVIGVILFLFYSKQKGYLFISAVTILVLTSLSVIRRLFPLYFEYSILHHIKVAGLNSYLMEIQSYDFISSYWILCILYIIYLYKPYATFRTKRLKKNHILQDKINESFIQSLSIDIFDVAIFIAVIILTFFLGRHNGNYYTYYGEILLPFLLYLIIPKIDEIFKNNLNRFIIQLLILVFCVFPFRMNYKMDITPINGAFSTLSHYADLCKHIYDETPLAALYKIEHNMFPIYNNGQIEYANTVIPNGTSIFDKFSTIPVNSFEQQLIEWNDGIENNIKNQKFDCIFTESERKIDNYIQVAKIENVLSRTVFVSIPSEP